VKGDFVFGQDQRLEQQQRADPRPEVKRGKPDGLYLVFQFLLKAHFLSVLVADGVHDIIPNPY
jgi:hypothetical protein